MNTNTLRLINAYIAKNGAKFELNGLYVDAEANALVATDTRAMIIYSYEGLNNTVIVPKKVIEALTKVYTKNKPAAVKITDAGEGTMIVTDDFSITGEIKGTDSSQSSGYPEWQRIVPNTLPNVVKTPANALEFELAKAGIKVDVKKYIQPIMDYLEDKEVKLHYTDAESVLMVECDEFKVVLMPIVYRY